MKNVRIIFIISMLITCVSMGVVVFMALAESDVNFGETSLSELLKNENTQVIFIMPVVLLIIAASLIPFYRTIFPVKIKNGVKAKARVLEVNDTGVTINDNPQVRIKLELRTHEGTTLEVEAKTVVSRLSVGNVQPGVLASVVYDPLKPERIQVESFEIEEQPPSYGEAEEERPPSPTERLLELSDLRARGLVTEEEYQAKRAEILEDL